MSTKDKENFSYTNLRITDDYKYDSENEKDQRTSKKPTKTDVNELNERIIKKEASMGEELF